ncbi:recombinase family protein [uncultured Bacteroides sp.]|uniref:recombinase family protein n=1 Tax=uncultured Bacteroides sp. TaxID=162156 RepID=UPI002659A5F9|nr:recombinase family protein [uncultured Bacteroides sp.]
MEVEVIKAKRNLTDRSKGKKIDRMRVAAYCRVSTDSEDQLHSYRSQVQYYTDLIEKNKEWVMTEIYADEAITGTQITKREGFQRMISDCMDGKIDMVITKSISRFARNTLDTLKYVRMLKENNVAIFFEDENINTLTMDGELLLVVLSSVAQQEVENISDNVKKGLKMKMKRGELVGFQGCIGYDYDPETKSISVNPDEVEIVKYIFTRYVQGAGSFVISRELNELGYKTKLGNDWTQSTVIGVIKNEKYKGDILLGKTFTVDPISKRRLENLGEEDQFYIKNHHEPIISEEMFDKAHEILKKRGKSRSALHQVSAGKREKFTRQYAFSCMLECGFCGSNLSRRRWHSGSDYSKIIWSCVTGTKKGKKFCPDSKGIPEKVIEDAFIESYKLLCGDNREVLDEFIERVEVTLSESNIEKSIEKIDKEITSIESKKKKLLDMCLEDKIDQLTYEAKMEELSEKSKKLLVERQDYVAKQDDEKNLKRRTKEFKALLEKNQVLEEFDRGVFESIIEKVIVGEIDENGNKDPYKLTFVYKTGISNKVDPKIQQNTKLGESLKAELKKMCSHAVDEVKEACSHILLDTR